MSIIRAGNLAAAARPVGLLPRGPLPGAVAVAVAARKSSIEGRCHEAGTGVDPRPLTAIRDEIDREREDALLLEIKQKQEARPGADANPA